MPRSRRTLVCTCEDVTLKDVEHAMEKGHRDVESVKRFTGLGTGVCQGRHCLGTLARALTDRGVPAEDVRPMTPRPPLDPVPLAVLAAAYEDDEEAK